jgi:outer membrane protein assembly factor BamA
LNRLGLIVQQDVNILRTIAVLGTLAGCVGAGYAADVADATAIPSARELEAQGAVIGAIYIDAQNIFDLNDARENTGLYRFGNALHVTTREHVIRHQLLFRTGDRFMQHTLDESERILRSARYLYDASVRPVAWHDGKVDVLVTTHDVWTLNPGISFGRHGGTNTYGFELEELNILGTGTSIAASHKSGIDRSSDTLEFRDQHLFDTWASLALTYSNNSDGSTKGFSLERPFYSLDTSWSAGAHFLDDDRVESLYDGGRIIDQFQQHARRASISGGWSSGLVDGWTHRWTTGLSYDETRFDTSPYWSGPTTIPQDRKFVYPWMGIELVQDDFTKTRNRDQIGRTEDFQLGMHFSAHLGWADRSFGSDRDAAIFDAAAGYGFNPGAESTLLFSTGTSGRLEDGSFTNTVLNGAVRYYLQQSDRRLFFITAQGMKGYRLDRDNQILLGGDNGLRGYPLRYQAGDASALLTMEERYFTNWYPFRLFRIGAAAFFDVGRTWGGVDPDAPGRGLLRDIGIGLRIGNTRSGLGNMIHVDLAFPLDGDSSISNVQLIVETKQKF